MAGIEGKGNTREHQCSDGKVRRVEPVYFREIGPQTGRRRFVRRAWFCGRCGYGDWPVTQAGVARGTELAEVVKNSVSKMS